MKSSRGFTLLEVLVAVAILATTLAALISGMARHADNAGYIRQKTIALWVAHNQLSEMKMAATWPDTGTSDGKVDMAGIAWKWIADVKTTPDDHLRRIDISVQREGNDATLATLSGFIGKP
ncbi:type II secretion system minor pseudopilin GspI [Stenotrophobium rhamnosiphilum]|uniref:Type II secretion system protein I n=1 Tax=Stenotrophobium rhamnosiphilum TaxID=2029166 RepID=A0A2T5MH84_9GAMM|nr:type II secretion system minor pseudopilin GspI [Stenotrophobium rhamnosiphilum]PTU31925.1 type II secretion system protein GspI [Stenotrophobium rhamnosiphilum]